MMWPDYCSKEVLAKRLNLPAACIDQLVKRGLLPPPVTIGEAKRWRWETIDLFLAARRHEDTIADDVYLNALRQEPVQDNAPKAPASTVRDFVQKPRRQGVSVLPARPRDTDGGGPDQAA